MTLRIIQKLGQLFIVTAALGVLTLPATAEPMIYVAAGSANKVLAIDPNTNTVIREFEGIENPHALTITPDGEYVIAGSLKERQRAKGDTRPPESSIYIIHPVHGHVMSTIPVDGMIHHQAITPDGRYVISTHPTRGGISYTDIMGERGPQNLKTGPGPNYTVVSRDGAKAYVSNSGNGKISEIDLRTWIVTRNVDGGPSPEHLALSADEKTLYALSARAGRISAINVGSGKVEKSWEIGKSAHGLDISEDGRTLFATNRKLAKLMAITLASGDRREMTLSPQPYHLEFLPGLNRIYVSSRKEPKIWVIDPDAWKVVAEIAISGEGHQMVLGN